MNWQLKYNNLQQSDFHRDSSPSCILKGGTAPKLQNYAGYCDYAAVTNCKSNREKYQ